MGKFGTTKQLSVAHEDYIADRYNGRRSRSSGAADNDSGDVRSPEYLIECKMTGSPSKPLARTPTLVQHFEKVTEEAWAEGKDPMVALRYYLPNSPLANSDGWVDLIVKRVVDDVG
jgi:hypothetical protein